MKIWLLLAPVIFMFGCSNTYENDPGLVAYHVEEAWIEDSESGCKVNRYYVPDAVSVSWQGPCIDGFAIGKGKLTWVDSAGIDGMYRSCLQPDHPNSACFMGGGGKN